MVVGLDFSGATPVGCPREARPPFDPQEGGRDLSLPPVDPHSCVPCLGLTGAGALRCGPLGYRFLSLSRLFIVAKVSRALIVGVGRADPHGTLKSGRQCKKLNK